MAMLISGCVSPQSTSPVPPENPTTTPQAVTEEITTGTETDVFPSPDVINSTGSNDPVLKRVAQIRGNVNGIAVLGNTAYIGLGSRIAALDIKDHERSRIVSQSEPLAEPVSLILLIPGDPGLFLLVAAGTQLHVLDLSPENLFTPIHQLGLSGKITAMIYDVESKILYVGSKTGPSSGQQGGVITTLAFSLVEGLTLLENINMPEFPLSLGLAEGSLYAGAEGYQGGLYHIPLPAPGDLTQANLVIESTPIRPLQPFSLQVIGERLYVSYKAIEAYDISDPEKPQQVWMINVGGHVVREFHVLGDQIYWYGWTIKSEKMYEVEGVPEAISGSPMGLIASCTAMHYQALLVADEDFEIYEKVDP